MLSRTAEQLFWLGRYMERADNMARMIEAGRRLDAMEGKQSERSNEWTAVLIAAGCRTTFPKDLETAEAQDAIGHLLIDPANPSSIQSCITLARGNARAQRGSISADTWGAVNEAWRESLSLTETNCAPRFVATTLERVRRFASLFRGALAGTMIRDERLNFLNLGQYIERADATARLLDVKYHVLMPQDHPVGSAKDQLHWNTLLRAAGARSAYRWVYRKPVSSRLVIDFLLLNSDTPRSIRHCHEMIGAELASLHKDGSTTHESITLSGQLRSDLSATNVDGIIGFGLHEYLTDLIIRSNNLAVAIGRDFGFGPIIADETRVQNQ